MYKPGGTLRDAVQAIETGRYVLPAIQREFVWRPDQICRLFDSIMQGIPFGTFLFWRVEPKSAEAYKFYGFVRDYHERDNPHCPDLGPITGRELTAVLDGQQRLSALNIGLRGSMAWRLPNKWKTNKNAYPVKHLYLNLLHAPDPDEEGEAFQFRFLDEPHTYVPGSELWFRVPSILKMESGPPMLEWVMRVATAEGVTISQADMSAAYKVLFLLHRVIHSENKVSYYEEDSQSLERVLRIFIRLNSGGTVLSYSDLLLSIAVAQWQDLDARKEIHSLRDDLNAIGTGFSFSNDFILKAGLMLADISSVGFKVENFTRPNMAELEKRWSGIRRALILAVELAASFGLSGQGRWAESSLLPIAYYLHRLGAPDNFVTHSSRATDRAAIQSWLVRSLLKPSGIWGSALDTLLTALRGVIRASQEAAFPAGALETEMKARGKGLEFSEAEVEFLLDTSYPDYRTFLLLSFLYPFVDLKNHFHVDHVFPKSMLTPAQLRRAGIPPESIDDLSARANRLPNLQLLGGAENNEKRAKLPKAWLASAFATDAAGAEFAAKHDFGSVPGSAAEFAAFFDARRAFMKARLQKLLGVVSAPSGEMGSKLDAVEAVSGGAHQMESASWKAESFLHESLSGPSVGFLWRDVLLPDGTDILMTYKGKSFQAKIIGSEFTYEGRCMSPSEFASSVADGTSRNAWRDLMVKRPQDLHFLPADDFRRKFN
ncbi:DUF262 domain-containing protein [Roseomonas sp. SSH11]|uniref:DUF262 domain-containing protein n=2 Tax=Pararoseomonas baculiformis TaxID=2820812 RepID=A0ABS4ALU6_9PROT|nr:DUF262 domain-containing protein [Pararoseomonas baculiformis]